MGSNLRYIVHKDYYKWLSYKSEPIHDDKLDCFSDDDNSTMHMTHPNQTNARRIVMTLMSLGKEKIINEFRRHFELADYFREIISKDRSFELCKTKNQLNMVLFRLKGKSNEENAEFIDNILSWNKIFLVLSTVHDITFLRLSVGTFTHTRKDVKDTAEHIIKIAHQMRDKKHILRRRNCTRIEY